MGGNMRAIVSIMFLLLALNARAEPQPPTTNSAPSDPLIGRWQILATGEKKLRADIAVIWSFDERRDVVTLNGEVRTRSTYVLKPGKDRPLIELTDWGKSRPDRVGWYEIKDGHLRMHLSVFTGEPPAAWNEDEVMVFRPLPSSRSNR